MNPLLTLVQSAVNHRPGNGKPFDPATPFHPPRGRHATVHYGLMFPGLPAPLRFLDIITVIGQPAVQLFRNPQLVETTDADTANLLVGTGVTFPEQFSGFQVARDLELTDDASKLRFGDAMQLTGTYPNFELSVDRGEFAVDLAIEATDKVAHFVRLPFGIYDHWSLLCRHTGTVRYRDETWSLDGLNTLEYARGAKVRLPLTFFTYQIINADAETQVLMVEARATSGFPFQRAVYVRSLSHHGGVFERAFRFAIHERESEVRRTPAGRSMRLGTRFTWSVEDDEGAELISVDCVANDDYVYGMAGGYAGSYEYTGHFRGAEIEGTGYVEFIE